MNTVTCDKEMFCEVYRSAEMGKKSILSLMPKVKNDQLRADMTSQLNGYADFSKRASDGLTSFNAYPEEEKKSKVFAAVTGMAAETAFDSSSSNIAELIIRGSGADIISMTRAQNEATHGPCRIDSETPAFCLCRDMITFENGNIEKMKKYL